MAGVVAAFGQNPSNWEFKLENPLYGPTISFKGSRFNAGASFVCVEPQFRAQYFYLPKFPCKIKSDSTSLVIASDPNDPTPFFMDEMKFETTSPTSMRMVVDGRLTKDLPAAIEYIPLCIPARFMENATIEADGRTFKVASKDVAVNIPSETRCFVIKSKYGTITIRVEEGAGLVMSDRRTRTYKGREMFLFMLPSMSKLAMNDRFHHVISMEVSDEFKDFSPKAALPECLPKEGGAVEQPPVKYHMAVAPAMLYPQPKELKFTGGTVALPTTVTIATEDLGPSDHFARLLSELLDDNGIQRAVKNTIGTGFISVKKIIAPSADKYDYYELKVATDGVSIAAPTPQVAFYAMSTLTQLADANGGLRTAEVKDWADFQFRGIHLLADDASLPLHSSLIRHVFAPFKINHIILECEYARWPSHPEMHRPWSMSTDDMIKLISMAHDHFIDVSPLFQTLGHSEYLFTNKSNLDIAEDPANPYAYNISNPRSYRVIADLFADMRKIFPSSKYLHIGHDEVNNPGSKYPCRPENMDKTVLELFMKDLEFYRAYAAKQKITLIMWQDMLNMHHPDPAYIFHKVSGQLDTNIVIDVWDYQTKEDYPQLDMFQKAGCRVIGSPAGYDSMNVMTFSKSARKRRTLGMLQTTWTGHGGNANAMLNYPGQIWTYAQAGVSFWNADSPFIDYNTPSYATRAFDRVLKERYPRRYFFTGSETLVPLDLDHEADVTLAEEGGFHGGALTTRYGVVFKLASGGMNAAGVKVKGSKPSFEMTVGKKAKAISFLFAGCGEEKPQIEIGSITVATDAGTVVQPLIVEREIGNLYQQLGDSGRLLGRSSAERYFIVRPVFSAKGKYVH